MDKTSVNWAGPMPAVTTPFDAKGHIDRAGFRENIARLMKAGATGVVACGCTGEFWSLSADEKKQLYADAVAAVKGKGTVIVGVGCVGPADTIALAHEAKAAGADGVLVLPPYFVKL
jgi:dihydrodipicolinate synthase/N-acetylneuraminate lyase